MNKRLLVLALVMLTPVILTLSACENPNKLVSQTTADGRFALTLRKERDWVRPGESLPVWVAIESLDGPLPEELVLTVDLIANNGEVDPAVLLAVFPGPGDAPDAKRARFGAWVVFKAATFTAATRDARDPVPIAKQEQGEIHALFLDALTLLRFSIVPTEASHEAL